MKQIQIIVEKHTEGYVAYPLGLKGAVVGEGDIYVIKFPRDPPKTKVIKIFEKLGFEIVKVGNHVSMIKENPNGSKTPLIMPNHKRINGSTLRTIADKLKYGGRNFPKSTGEYKGTTSSICQLFPSSSSPEVSIQIPVLQSLGDIR